MKAQTKHTLEACILGIRWRKKSVQSYADTGCGQRDCLFSAIALQEFGIISSTAREKPTTRLNFFLFRNGLTFSFPIKGLLSYLEGTAGSKFPIKKLPTQPAKRRKGLHTLSSSSSFFPITPAELMSIHTCVNCSQCPSPRPPLPSQQSLAGCPRSGRFWGASSPPRLQAELSYHRIIAW